MNNNIKQIAVSPAKSQIDEIVWSTKILNPFDDPVEIRAFKAGQTVSGYFKNRQRLAEEALNLDKAGYQVYVTLNRVDGVLHQNAPEQIIPYPKKTTSDRDIVRRLWFACDLDPIRPSGVSSTDDEKRVAQELAEDIRAHLASKDWPEPVLADSGNGMHLLYPVDLENTSESLLLVKDCLKALAFKFSTDEVDVDISVANAARIWKLYGCMAKKGDNTPHRPHRASRILEVPDALRIRDEVA